MNLNFNQTELSGAKPCSTGITLYKETTGTAFKKMCKALPNPPSNEIDCRTKKNDEKNGLKMQIWNSSYSISNQTARN